MGCTREECGVYDKTIHGCWQGLEPDQCGVPLITKTNPVATLQYERGVISPDSLKAGVFALMCMVKGVLTQYEYHGEICPQDLHEFRNHYEKMDKALKEMGL